RGAMVPSATVDMCTNVEADETEPKPNVRDMEQVSSLHRFGARVCQRLPKKNRWWNQSGHLPKRPQRAMAASRIWPENAAVRKISEVPMSKVVLQGVPQRLTQTTN